MARVPFIGRLHPAEYLALAGSFVLLFLELIVRTVTLALPGPIIRFFYLISRRAFNSLSSPRSRRNRSKKKAVSSPIAQAHDFVELCELYGYYAEEHIVQTKDGYLLGLHRLGWKRGEEEVRVNSGPGSVEKKVVYMHHGLMMNSEVWVCITEKERCLPFLLVEQGYDVWLGNNRGNKYSKKSVHHSPTEIPFWNFSMDQFAFHDIPDSINYILETTLQPSLSYIGFSQGTAQAFATLSIHPTLNHKVDVFVALAPAMAPPGLASGIVSSFVKSSPEVLFLAFGRRAMLGSATMWQALLYPGIFVYFIDKSLSFLFGWKTRNITAHQKLAAYPHLYSFTSTKSVVHWFQIIRNGTFQMYDDEVTSPLQFSNSSKYYKVAKFPTRNIKTPIFLIYGGSDSLVDIKLMLKELPRHTVAKGIDKYEHLDLLWASDVDKLVFPHVLEALDSYAQPEKTKSAALGWGPQLRTVSSDSPAGSQPPGYSEDERQRRPTRTTPHGFDFAFENENDVSTADEHPGVNETDADDDETDVDLYTSSPRPKGVGARVASGSTNRTTSTGSTNTTTIASAGAANTNVTGRRILSPRARSREQRSGLDRSTSGSRTATEISARMQQRPEGWWSSDNSAPPSVRHSPLVTESQPNAVASSVDGTTTPTPLSPTSRIPTATNTSTTFHSRAHRDSDPSFTDRGISLQRSSPTSASSPIVAAVSVNGEASRRADGSSSASRSTSEKREGGKRPRKK